MGSSTDVIWRWSGGQSGDSSVQLGRRPNSGKVWRQKKRGAQESVRLLVSFHYLPLLRPSVLYNLSLPPASLQLVPQSFIQHALYFLRPQWSFCWLWQPRLSQRRRIGWCPSVCVFCKYMRNLSDFSARGLYHHRAHWPNCQSWQGVGTCTLRFAPVSLAAQNG